MEYLLFANRPSPSLPSPREAGAPNTNGEVVVDGQLLTLPPFGKMVETFEGFEFRLDIRD